MVNGDDCSMTSQLFFFTSRQFKKFWYFHFNIALKILTEFKDYTFILHIAPFSNERSPEKKEI